VYAQRRNFNINAVGTCAQQPFMASSTTYTVLYNFQSAQIEVSGIPSMIMSQEKAVFGDEQSRKDCSATGCVPAVAEGDECKHLLQHCAPGDNSFSWVKANGELLQDSDVDKLDVLRRLGSNNDVLDLLEYNSCIEKNDPPPNVLVTHRLRILILLATRSQNEKDRNKALTLLAKSLLQSFDDILRTCDEVDNDQAVRRIEAQVQMRLQFWAMIGDPFVRWFRKLGLGRKQKRRRGRSEKTNICNILCSEVTDLLSIVSIRLPLTKTFPAFLESCLDKTFYCSSRKTGLPKDLFEKIFDFFEIARPTSVEEQDVIHFPFKKLSQRLENYESGDTTTSSKALNDTPKVNKIHQSRVGQPQCPRKQTLCSSDTVRQRVPISALTASIFPQAAPPLIAPLFKKRNSLLIDRPHFVGSHFNTNTSNISSLFRQVKATKAKTPTLLSSKQMREKKKSTSKCSLIPPSSALKNANRVRSKARRVTISNDDRQSGKHSRSILKSDDVVEERPKKARNEIITAESTIGMIEARQVVAAARSALKKRQY
jgi:hypothetical protein